MDEKIDRRDLIELVKLIDAVVEIQFKYIRVGFSLDDVASTFAELYFRQFEHALDEDSMKQLRTEKTIEAQINGCSNHFETTCRAIMQMGLACIRTINEALKCATSSKAALK